MIMLLPFLTLFFVVVGHAELCPLYLRCLPCSVHGIPNGVIIRSNINVVLVSLSVFLVFHFHLFVFFLCILVMDEAMATINSFDLFGD
jgi:hypothetical protein